MPIDITLLQVIAQGGATVAFLWLVIDTRRESREREQRYIDLIDKNESRFIMSLEGNTSALVAMDSNLKNSLDEMRRKLDS